MASDKKENFGPKAGLGSLSGKKKKEISADNKKRIAVMDAAKEMRG